MADPSPYTYQYRKPRPGNRTFQSYNAYQSLYHMGKVQPPPYGSNFMGDHYSSRAQRYTPANLNPYSQNISQQPQEEKVQYSEPARKESGPSQKRYENMGINTDRYSNRDEQNRSVKSRSSSMSINNNNLPPQGRNSILSTYGSNSLARNKGNAQQYKPREPEVNLFRPQLHQTANVYHRQQRPYDIVNLYQKNPEPLKKYHKLTQEHLLLERGMDFPN